MDVFSFRRFPSARVSHLAKIGYGTQISDGAVIGPEVTIGDNNIIGEYVVILPRVHIGNHNTFLPGCVIGTPSSQRIAPWVHRSDLPSEEPLITIGDHNILGEYSTVRLPMQERTNIHSHAVIGAHCHVANDVEIQHHSFIAPGSMLGGYVTIGIGARLGLGVTVHQRLTVGAYSMCGMAAAILHNIAPGSTVAGIPCRYLHPNVTGMRRYGLTESEIAQLSAMLDGESMDDLDQKVVEIVSDFAKSIRKWSGRQSIVPKSFTYPIA